MPRWVRGRSSTRCTSRGVLVRLESPSQVFAKDPGKLARVRLRGGHHECHRHRQPVLGSGSHHRRLAHSGVLEQPLLRLARREPLARHLEEVVVATPIGEEALLVHAHHVARDVPLADEGAAGLTGAAPVGVRARIAPHPHPPHLAWGDLPAIFVAEPHLEARDRGAEGAGTRLARPVGDEDVPHLGRAQPVEELDSEDLVPATVEGKWERLAGRGGKAEAPDIVEPGVRVGEHVVHHRGDVDEDRGPVALDLTEDFVGRGALGEEHRRRADGEGEEEVGAGRVAEVELRHRERDVVCPVADHLPGVALGGVDEGGVALHDALGPPGGAAREEPDRGIVGV